MDRSLAMSCLLKHARDVRSLARRFSSQVVQDPKTNIENMPPHAKALGYLGVLPFWLFSTPVVEQLPVLGVMAGLSTSDFGTLQVAYGATILSFLGGVHWGLSMTTLTPIKYTAERYLWSVMPCLAAFPTLIMPTPHGAGIQAALIGLVYATDRSWAKRGGLPPWYMKLRAPLSVFAASGLGMTALYG
jgi:hypothetical protein